MPSDPCDKRLPAKAIKRMTRERIVDGCTRAHLHRIFTPSHETLHELGPRMQAMFEYSCPHSWRADARHRDASQSLAQHMEVTS